MDHSNIRAVIRAEAHKLGFDSVGFTLPAMPRRVGTNLTEYLERGYQGDMNWLESRAKERIHPLSVWNQTKSIIVLGVNYGPGENPLALLDHPNHAVLSVYTRGRDYHDVIKKRLKKFARWLTETYGSNAKVFVDTAPIMEKPIAAKAGVGWQGKHTNLVSREFGSWLFLGSVFTTLELEPDTSGVNHCGTCQACLDVCPTNAFPAPYQLDARRCISYLTIEHKGHIAREFRIAIGNRIFGCDDCLAICPWNKYAKRTVDTAFIPRSDMGEPLLEELAKLDDQKFRKRFAGTAIKRTGRNRFIRNVLIGLGNTRNEAMYPVIEPLLSDISSLVRAMAVWALAEIVDRVTMTKLEERYLSGETDKTVREEWKIASGR